jgi:uncharacterized protein YcfJ
MTKFKMGTSLVSLTLLLSIQACSQQQVISSTVSVAKLPVKAVGAVAGTAGGVVGGTVGGLVAGDTGRRYGSMAGQSAARNAVPSL